MEQLLKCVVAPIADVSEDMTEIYIEKVDINKTFVINNYYLIEVNPDLISSNYLYSINNSCPQSTTLRCHIVNRNSQFIFVNALCVDTDGKELSPWSGWIPINNCKIIQKL